MDSHEIITRKEAIERGLKRYFTGKPCKNGHVEERHTKYRECMQCNREASNATYRKWHAQKRMYELSLEKAEHGESPQDVCKFITLQEAKAIGLKRYFDGQPCGRGHISQRTVQRRDCVQCSRLAAKKYKSSLKCAEQDQETE